jgi:hypothetical protein
MKKTLLLISTIAFLFTSCDKDKAIATDITINFTHTVDASELMTNSMIYTNEAGENYDIQTLKYLISEIALHSEDGSSLLLDEVHFIDISDESTFSLTYNEVPNNNYTSISFDMGLDTAKNISYEYVNDDFHATMFWPELNGGGYHYMKLEGAYNNYSTFYNTHTGGTMGADYSFNHVENISLTVDNDLGNISVNINMELNNWYNSPQIEFSSYGMGIMMNMMMQNDIKVNGSANVFSVTVDK